MELKTASSVINYLSKIEHDSSEFYSQCADRYADFKNLFKSMAKENKKFGERIKRVYYGSVTDALETNFSFKGLAADIDIPKSRDSKSAEDLVGACLKLERNIQSFYTQAAELSKGLLDDVNRVMDRLAKARDKRVEELNSNLGSSRR